MDTIKSKILNALKMIGVKGHVIMFESYLPYYKIYVDDEYYGLFDAERNTFVD